MDVQVEQVRSRKPCKSHGTTRSFEAFGAHGGRRWSSFTGPWRTASSNPLVIPKGAQCARRRLRRSLRGAACQLPDPWRRTLLTLC